MLRIVPAGGEAFAPREGDVEVAASTTGRAAWGSVEGSFAPGSDQKVEVREAAVTVPERTELKEEVVPKKESLDKRAGLVEIAGQETESGGEKGKGKERETVEQI